MKRVKAYDGLPVEVEGIEDAERVAALVGFMGLMLSKLGLKRLEISDDGVIVAEG